MCAKKSCDVGCGVGSVEKIRVMWGVVWGVTFERFCRPLTKNVPLRKVRDAFLAPLTVLIIKVVYFVSKRWYGLTYAAVCVFIDIT